MRFSVWVFIIFLFVFAGNSVAMGLRSFVALPLERGGMVFRFQDIETFDNDNNIAIVNYAYGITGTQTLLLSMPYRLSPSGGNRSGDLSALYRHTVWQHDFQDGTYRLGLLGGGLIPTHSASDGGAQAGAVATFYQGRQELDIDGLWGQGFGQSPNRAQYDVSYQFRLSPAIYPETGLTAEWDGVVEYNGRYIEGNPLIHQTTVGLQWIHASWVLEGGFIHDINSPHETKFIISTRFHI